MRPAPELYETFRLSSVTQGLQADKDFSRILEIIFWKPRSNVWVRLNPLLHKWQLGNWKIQGENSFTRKQPLSQLRHNYS